MIVNHHQQPQAIEIDFFELLNANLTNFQDISKMKIDVKKSLSLEEKEKLLRSHQELEESLKQLKSLIFNNQILSRNCKDGSTFLALFLLFFSTLSLILVLNFVMISMLCNLKEKNTKNDEKNEDLRENLKDVENIEKNVQKLKSKL